jgi:hypothetical protein
MHTWQLTVEDPDFEGVGKEDDGDEVALPCMVTSHLSKETKFQNGAIEDLQARSNR